MPVDLKNQIYIKNSNKKYQLKFLIHLAILKLRIYLGSKTPNQLIEFDSYITHA